MIAETQVVHKDPATLMAGKHLILQGVRHTNQDSRILAGGDLRANVNTLDNLETMGQRVLTDVDTDGRGSLWHQKPGKRKWGEKKSSKVSRSQYGPFETVTTLPLHLMEYQPRTSPTGTGSLPDPRSSLALTHVPTAAGKTTGQGGNLRVDMTNPAAAIKAPAAI
ncbi:hypothetical protein [Xenorhabdus cabanillasii]|uniref:Uncharacterized protein n=1 Tax=Xenorhabdus cabanillasii JM26 TaxID=1427517 RepID=W1IPT1_9GAMM|nr:hypothetical protein [Xenorhabdus cabanillasii]PHM75534.1 hypothetical protein Xcab_03982 [Xenorhabdus cabanillasii JM26]CDL79843.1 hypothetical protein XCR1_1250020 [Xenorhabdus cabanillasii JM26]